MPARRNQPMDVSARGRRRFLHEGAALAGLALPASQPASTNSDLLQRRAYGRRSPYETSMRENYAPEGHTPLHEQLGIITPSALHYVVSHGYEPPDIDPGEHRLLLHGLVDRPLIYTLDELKRLPSVSRIHFIECAGNTSPGLNGRPRNSCSTRTAGRVAVSGLESACRSCSLKRDCRSRHLDRGGRQRCGQADEKHSD
jgi:hypothetical protein